MRTRLAVVAGVSIVVVPSCAGEDALPTASSATIGSVPAGSASETITTRPAGSATPATSPATTIPVSTAPEFADSAVLAAAVLWRATAGNSWDSPDRFQHFYVVERLGQAHPDRLITGANGGRVLDQDERAAIEAALAPRTVQWVASWDAVVDERATTTLPDDRAIITIGELTMEGTRAEVATALWCGFDCAIGSTSVLERSPNGEWTVTDHFGGYIS